MSFDLFLQFYENQLPNAIPVKVLREAFSPHLNELEPQFWRVHCDDLNHCDVYLGSANPDAGSVESVTISRPCVDLRLYNSLASILTYQNCVLFFPGCRAPMVTHNDVIEHLPPDLLNTLGRPVCVKTGQEIVDEIHKA